MDSTMSATSGPRLFRTTAQQISESFHTLQYPDYVTFKHLDPLFNASAEFYMQAILYYRWEERNAAFVGFHQKLETRRDFVLTMLNQCRTTYTRNPELRLKFWQCRKKLIDAALDALNNISGLYTELLDKTIALAATISERERLGIDKDDKEFNLREDIMGLEHTLGVKRPPLEQLADLEESWSPEDY